MSNSKMLKFAVFAAIIGQCQFVYGGMDYCAQANEKKAAARPRIDLAFCIDTTGSMQNEINVVKAKTKEIVAKLAGGKPSPLIRVGVVAFRDRQDDYVTKVFPFTDDIDKVVGQISSLKAQGGGDTPEAVGSGLHASVNELEWAKDHRTLKLLFLIGDAGPSSRDEHDWRAQAKAAIARGIQVNTIACDGLQNLNANGEQPFREIARLTDGKFDQLTYKQEIVNAEGRRETLVSSGGKTYALAPSSAADWKEGAASLMAAGKAKSISYPVAAAKSVSYGAEARGRSAFSSTRSMSLGSADSAYMAAPPMAAPVSRQESNLADIVVEATKKAAERKMKLGY